MTDETPSCPAFRAAAVVRVGLDREPALALFTARGERRWVPGWAPEFPAGEPPAGKPEREGTVFVTHADGRATIWVVALRETGRIRYARTTPGVTAGTVEVRVIAATAGATSVEVTYDLTALSDAGAAELAAFAAGFDDTIGAWEDLIAAALG